MSRRSVQRGTLAGAAVALPLLGAAAAPGAVSLNFSDGDATPASTAVAAGVTFPVSVVLTESATADRVSGFDYRLQVNAAGSGDFRIMSRATTTSLFTPEAPDASAAVAPVTLSPTSGTTDYGADRNGQADLAGVNTYDTADYTIRVLPGTPNGVYTLSFVPANTTYSGATASNFPTLAFASTGTFTVTVPEPATAAGLFVSAAAVLGGRRSARLRRVPVD